MAVDNYGSDLLKNKNSRKIIHLLTQSPIKKKKNRYYYIIPE